MQLIFISFILFVIPSVISLKCYVCNSNEYPICENDNDLDSFIETCEQDIEPYCRKIQQTVNGKTSIVRTCGSTMGTKACYKTPGLNHAHVCSCNEDLCNHASNFNQSTIFIIVSLLITMILFRR